MKLKSVDSPSTGQVTELVSRRSLLATSLAVGAGIATLATNDSARAVGEHEHGPAPHQALIDAGLNCVNRGEVCVNHCIGLLSSGDTSMKDCLRAVSAMLPMCSTLARLAALDAARLKDFAKVCIDVCADCEQECKKHQDHHAVCKACAESCAACIKECKAVMT